MNVADFEERFAALVLRLGEVASVGPGSVQADIAALRNDLAKLAETGVPSDDLVQMAQTLTLLAESIALPGVAESFAMARAASSEPQPEIFDAIEDCDIEAVQTALASGDVNARYGQFGCTPLYRAMSCITGTSLEVIDLLLDAGADPRKGLTSTNVLHGLGFGRFDGTDPHDLALRVRRCVSLGADIEERSDKLRWTPLITAVSEWNPVATEALLLAGADINARAGDVEGVCFAGERCLRFAEGHEPTMAVLKQYLTRP